MNSGVWTEPAARTGIDNLSINGTAAAPSSLQLVISHNADTPGNYDFEWTSQPGKLYDLVGSTDLRPTRQLAGVAGSGQPARVGKRHHPA